MQLPTWWGQPCFTVVEAAELAGVPEMTLRTWLARCPVSEFLGERQGGRVFLAAKHAFCFALVAKFTRFGVPVRVAILTAADFARGIGSSQPGEHLVVVVDGDRTSFDLTQAPDIKSAALVILINQLAQDFIANAATIYATEAA